MKRKAEIKRWIWCWYIIETIDEAIHKIEALWDNNIESQIMPSWNVQVAYSNWYKEWHSKALEALVDYIRNDQRPNTIIVPKDSTLNIPNK